MKTVIIGPNVGIGGVERASTNIANGLVQLGHEVIYLALIPEKPFFDLYSDYIEPKGFNRTHMSLFKTLVFIRKNVKMLEPESILCYTKFYAALANLALVGTKYSIVVTERSSPLYKWPLRVELVSKFSFWLKKPKAVISQTSIASGYHQKYYGNTQYHIIPNTVQEIKKYSDVEREKIILAVGRLHDPCKGFDLLVKAFNFILDKEWRLVFAGGTREEGKYLLDLADAPKKSKIDFLGAVKNTDLLYARAGIFVMPSRSEGFPNALAEAMCAGCCCVSFDFIAGPKDLIEDGVTGTIIPAENIKALAEAINELISNDNKREKLQNNAVQIRNMLIEDVIIDRYEKALINE